jgi:chromosome segregation ATPase
MYQALLDFIARFFSSQEARSAARLKESELVVKMSMELAAKLTTRLEVVEATLRVVMAELDEYKSHRFTDQATIADLQRRLTASEEKEKSYERTIAELRGRIAELEVRNGNGH